MLCCIYLYEPMGLTTKKVPQDLWQLISAFMTDLFTGIALRATAALEVMRGQ